MEAVMSGDILDFREFERAAFKRKRCCTERNSKNKLKKAQRLHDIKVLEGVSLAEDRAFTT